jgi:hypothetical protein
MRLGGWKDGLYSKELMSQFSELRRGLDPRLPATYVRGLKTLHSIAERADRYPTQQSLHRSGCDLILREGRIVEVVVRE